MWNWEVCIKCIFECLIENMIWRYTIFTLYNILCSLRIKQGGAEYRMYLIITRHDKSPAKLKGSIWLLVTYADASFWICTAEHISVQQSSSSHRVIITPMIITVMTQSAECQEKRHNFWKNICSGFILHGVVIPQNAGGGGRLFPLHLNTYVMGSRPL